MLPADTSEWTLQSEGPLWEFWSAVLLVNSGSSSGVYEFRTEATLKKSPLDNEGTRNAIYLFFFLFFACCQKTSWEPYLCPLSLVSSATYVPGSRQPVPSMPSDRSGARQTLPGQSQEIVPIVSSQLDPGSPSVPRGHPAKLIKCRCPGPGPRKSESRGLGWGPGISVLTVTLEGLGVSHLWAIL